jgi:TPR repeat protein
MEPTDSQKDVTEAYRLLKDKNYVEAFDLFRGARDAGLYAASTFTGYMYQHGLGRVVDEDKALEAYRDGAAHGVERSKLFLARLLCERRQYTEAAELFRTLAADGNVSAKYWLYVVCRDGLGIAQDREKARALLEQAVASGHLYAIRDLSKRSVRGEYGAFAILRGGWMVLHGMYRWAFALANEPNDDKLH